MLGQNFSGNIKMSISCSLEDIHRLQKWKNNSLADSQSFPIACLLHFDNVSGPDASTNGANWKYKRQSVAILIPANLLCFTIQVET